MLSIIPGSPPHRPSTTAFYGRLPAPNTGGGGQASMPPPLPLVSKNCTSSGDTRRSRLPWGRYVGTPCTTESYPCCIFATPYTPNIQPQKNYSRILQTSRILHASCRSDKETVRQQSLETALGDRETERQQSLETAEGSLDPRSNTDK